MVCGRSRIRVDRAQVTSSVEVTGALHAAGPTVITTMALEEGTELQESPTCHRMKWKHTESIHLVSAKKASRHRLPNTGLAIKPHEFHMHFPAPR